MAKETTEVAEDKKTIFYAYEYIDRALKLKKRGPFISWKYGRRYKDEISGEILFEDVDKDIRFEDGVFVTQNADQIAYLNLYNTGGKFKLANGGREVEVTRDPQMNVIISTEDLLTRQVVKTTEVVREVAVIPKSALGLFDVQALKDFCIAEGIDMPAEKTKDALVDVLTQLGRIK
jgi:hypothetical protein